MRRPSRKPSASTQMPSSVPPTGMASAASTPAVAARQKQEISVSAAVQLNPNNPIPYEYGGFGLSVDGGFYIPFLGSNDNFFSTLLELRTLSVTHNACVTTKTDYVVGNGLRVTNLKEGQKEDPAFIDFRKNANGRRASLDKIVRAVCGNYQTFGNAPVEIVRGAVGKTKFVYIHSHNQLNCRLAKPNKNGEIDQMVYSPRLKRKGMLSDPTSTRFIPLWRRTKLKGIWKEDGKVERTALWLKNEMAGYEFYGMPSSVSSIQDQKIEHDATRYNIDNLENNMVLGGMLLLQGALTPEEAAKIAKQIINQHTGAGKRGRVAVASSEQEIKGSKFFQLDTKKEGSYEKLDDKAMQKILLANQWDATLAGLSDKSTLGNGSGYLQELYDQKMATVIGPLQKVLLDELIAPILEICDDWLGTKWSDYQMGFEPLPIVNRRNSALATSAEGIQAILNIAKAISDGYYTYETAVKLIASRFGISEQEAGDLIPKTVQKGKDNVPAQ